MLVKQSSVCGRAVASVIALVTNDPIYLWQPPLLLVDGDAHLGKRTCPERLALACGSAAVEGLSWRSGVKSEVPRIWILKGDGKTLPSVHHIKAMGQAAMLGSEEETSRFGLESLSIHPD